MKNTFYLAALTALVLTACSSNNVAAPVVNANSDVPPPAVIPNTQPNYDWQPVGTQQMPNPMPQPVYQAATSAPQVAAVTTTAAKAMTSQNFTIPRDANNLPIYSQIPKGFYQGDSYTVRKGDTMFLISYITGKDVKEIAALNQLYEPYALSVGQQLKLTSQKATSTVTNTSPTVAPDGTITGPIKASVGTEPSPRAMPTAIEMEKPQASTPPVVSSSVKWQWPTQGSVISTFSALEGGNKGIDIAGEKGQAVKAAAAGKVVYAGNPIPGYGNLVIIKHNDEFLSAYAHNDTIKVREQQAVKSGQTIATLGNSGATMNKLHFEIRYLGKSVDPLPYLNSR